MSRGRPPRVSDDAIRTLHAEGLTVAEIATAVSAALGTVTGESFTPTAVRYRLRALGLAPHPPKRPDGEDVTAALEAADGNMAAAGRELGLSRERVRQLVAKLGLDVATPIPDGPLNVQLCEAHLDALRQLSARGSGLLPGAHLAIGRLSSTWPAADLLRPAGEAFVARRKLDLAPTARERLVRFARERGVSEGALLRAAILAALAGDTACDAAANACTSPAVTPTACT